MRLRQPANRMTDLEANQGGRNHQSVLHVPTEETDILYWCPACRSQHTQRLSTVHMSGLSQFSAVTGGIGWTGSPAIGGAWTTGINPHQPKDVLGCIFGCVGVTRHMGQNRLLAIGKRYGPLTPTHYLVAIDSRLYGYINFSAQWKNEGVTTVALSEHDGQQRALLLLSAAGQFMTTTGVWKISRSKGEDRLLLATDGQEHWA